MKFIDALLAMAATALAMVGVAGAAPSVNFTWTATSGLGAPGSDSITAAVGDTLTLQMHITPDANNVTFAGLSFDPRTLGSVGAHTQAGVGSINTDILWDIYSTQNANLIFTPATYTGPSLAFLTGTGVTCPAGLGNLMAGVCGTFPVFSSPIWEGALLPDGTIGTFAMGALGAPGISGTFTLAEA
jgi:hypothetical protein